MKRLLQSKTIAGFSLIMLSVACSNPNPQEIKTTEKFATYSQLVTFFNEWREFQKPPLMDGVPDYSVASMKKQFDELKDWQQKLLSFDTTGWPIKHQVDWHILWAEMNGLEFDHRVLQPWVRDPAFYVWFFSYPSDVPAREGPHISGMIELPRFQQPLTEKDAKEIAERLSKTTTVYDQAKRNLTGNARDLWNTSITSFKEASEDLTSFGTSVKESYPQLTTAVDEAKKATDEFTQWLQSKAPDKTGPSGIGEENYNWYVHNVHLTPFTWHDEKLLLERELARAHSSLRFFEHQNRKLPGLKKANSPEAYQKLLTDGVNEFMDFFDKEEFITVKPFMKQAMLEQIRPFVPNDGLRGFFDEVDYRDPMPMRSHHFHWIDKAREILEPVESPIRKSLPLYNMYDSRAEGLATAMEELVMNAGMLENRPRAKELVFIMLAQRAARGLGGLFQHNNSMSFKEATDFASKWVPWGLAPADGSTLQHEEQFYLEQPGYGSSYIIGKLNIDETIAEYARQREGKFALKEFVDDYTTRGIIPTSLLYWEITGSRKSLDEAIGKK